MIGDKMDNLDIRILARLLNNCRESNRQIGMELQMTGGAVQARIRKMQRQGIIKGFLVNVEPPVLGLGVLYVVVSDQSTEEILEQARLVGMPYFVAPCVGGITVCSIVTKDSPERGIRLASRLMRDVRVLSMFEAGNPGFSPNLTRTDLEILEELIRDPRQRIESLSRATGMSGKTVTRCLEKLHGNDGIKFTLAYDPTKMHGFVAHVVLAWIREGGLREALEEMNERFSGSYLQVPFIARNQIVLFMYGRDIFETDELTQRVRTVSNVESIDLFIPKEISFYSEWARDAIAGFKKSPRLHPRYV